MIRIRYKDLSPGSHGKAERSRRGTTVYLLPGLTWGQRRAALRRLRQEASRGYGPALPGANLAVALAADRFRVGVRNTAAVVRLHPAASLLPTMLAGALMALFVLASVSARMTALPPPPAPPSGGASGGGAPTVIGNPVLAMGTAPVGQGSGSGGAGSGGGSGGSGSASAPGKVQWSLVASSGPVSGPAAAKEGDRSGTPRAGQACDPAGTRGSAGAGSGAGAGARGPAGGDCRPAVHPGRSGTGKPTAPRTGVTMGDG